MLKNEIFLDEYNKMINNFYDDTLKDKLINVFVSYYGEKYNNKISNLINSLEIIRISSNIEKLGFEEKAVLYFGKLQEQISNLGISVDSELFKDIKEVDSFSVYDIDLFIKKYASKVSVSDLMLIKKYFYSIKYYCNLMKINSNEENIILDSNVKNSTYKKSVSYEEISENIGGCAYMDFDDKYLIVINGYGIRLHSLIHEINHLLSKEILAYNEKKESFESHYGFRNIGDLFYEIINDYMAVDICNELSYKISEDYDFFVDKEIDSGYLEVDDVCDNFVKKIYDNYKYLIKDSLISGNGDKFIKILGRKNYVNINFTLCSVFDDMKNFFDNNPDASKGDFIIKEEYKNLINLYLELVDACFKQYDSYNKVIEEQLVELEKNGAVRRI